MHTGVHVRVPHNNDNAFVFAFLLYDFGFAIALLQWLRAHPLQLITANTTLKHSTQRVNLLTSGVVGARVQQEDGALGCFLQSA